jgi:hypothetical protein
MQSRQDMTRILSLGAITYLVFMATPAMAGCDLASEHCWLRAHRVMTHKQNHIAYLEANPDVDDGINGRIITHLHYKVLHIRAYIGPHWPHWPTPCCYSRPRLYVR